MRSKVYIHYGCGLMAPEEWLNFDVSPTLGVYCSHTLGHLSLHDFRAALRNTFKILKPGGIFRCVLPDLEHSAREYIKTLDSGDMLASIEFLEKSTMLGVTNRPKGLKDFIRSFWGNSYHLWIWDTKSLTEELENAGFREIRNCSFNGCEDKMFQFVEERRRFENAVAIESKK